MRKARVVLSMDFISTFDFGDIGILAGFNGLKFRTVDTILLETDPRVRTRILRQFKVALMSIASLNYGHQVLLPRSTIHMTYLLPS